MYSSQQVLFLLFLFLNLFGFSQTGPGGVGNTNGSSDLVLWFRTDNGLVKSGANVISWENSAGYTDLNLSVTSGTKPIVVSNTINGYDEVRFNAQGFLYTGFNLTTSNFVTNKASTFTVTQLISKTNSNTYGTYPLASNRFNAHFPWGNNRAYFDIGQCCGSSGRISKSQTLSSYYDYSVWTYGANGATGKQMYRNGSLLESINGTSTFNRHNTSRFQIGHNYKGNLPEIAVFKSKVNRAQRIIVDNYLAAKFGLSLDNNDLYTQDNSANGDFDHNVAGIGQASNGESHSDSQGTGIVRISTPSSLSNNDYLFWGEDVKQSVYGFSTDPISYKEHLGTKWRVTKRNDLGTVTVSFDLSLVDLSGRQTCQPLQLLVDNNSDFSTGVTYNLTIVGSIATVNNILFSDGDYFTLQYLDQVVWDGSSFFNGSGVVNAPNNTDSCLKLTVMSGSDAILLADTHVREIEVQTAATLVVSDGVLLTVEGAFRIDGITDVLGEAQIIQNHSGVSANAGNGELKITQQGTLNPFNYNYWSAPVNRTGFWKIKYLEEPNGLLNFAFQNNPDPTTTPKTLSSRWLYGFNAVQGDYYGWSYLGIEADIAPGIGYTMKGSGSTWMPMFTEENYIFKGIPNSGDYVYPVAAGNNFLVGNPYPSGLSATQFITDNLSVIDGTLYFWEQFGSNNTHVTANYQGGYATLNLLMGLSAVSAPATNGGVSSKGAPVSSIPLGQGFFINVKNGGNVIFNNAQRVFARESLAESTFFKSEQEISTTTTNTTDSRTKYWLTFSDALGRVREIGLGYDTNASNFYDNGYDAEDYDNLPDYMLWSIPNYKLSIQALQTFNIDDEIPLALKIETPGNFTIGLKETQNFPESVGIFLKDNLNNLYYNLKTADATLFLSTGEDNTRYSIVYQEANTLGVITSALASKFSVTYNNEFQQLIINNIDQINVIKSFKIYNLLGQQIIAVDALESNVITLPKVANGVYVIEVEGKDKSKFTKKFVKD